MASLDKSKKNRTKAPKGRPAGTSAISQPVVQHASALTALSAFSPKGNLFAFLSLAVDKHRLRVYDTTTGHSVAEHVSDAARVTSLAWSTFEPAQAASPADDSPNKKKRKKRNSVAAVDAEKPLQGIEVVLLGLSDGSLVFFSPSHGRVLRTLSHSSSTAAILSAVSTEDTEGVPTVWTSGADGTVRLWNAHKNEITGSWKNDDRIPYSSMAARPGSLDQEDGRVDLLLANHGIRLVSTTQGVSLEAKKPKELASFTGHASSINHLQWDASQEPATRFLTVADGDRFVYIWQVPSTQGGEGRIVASISLDSDARSVAFSSTSPSDKQTLLILSASGKIAVYPVPSELSRPAGSGKSQAKVSTLLARSNIYITSKKNLSVVQVVGASFAHGEDGKIRVARVIGGVRPVFEFVQYLDATGDFIQDINIIQDDSGAGLATQDGITALNKRYVESSSLTIRSGAELGEDAEMDDLAVRGLDGDLNVDLAELSLGQRLTAISSLDDAAAVVSSSEDEGEDGEPSSFSRKSKKKSAADAAATVIPANSLTRTLIQALHSSDARLLETCLAHSDLQLIRNTVRRLPPQLAVPLLTACVERLGRGGRAGNMKGGGGGASSQRGAALIGWVKAVLAVHSGHLMTMPDLVARLSGLHATLTSRLTLQDSLLSLSGRLDMVPFAN